MQLQKLMIGALAALSIQTAAAQELVFAVNEGVTYQDGSNIQDRYKPLLDLLEKDMKKRVRLVKVERYTDIEKGLAEARFDLAFIHPGHIGLSAVKAGQYQGLATAKGYTDYHARILVSKDSPLKSAQDLQGKKIGVPSMESITTVMFLASLRQAKFQQPEKMVVATRFQDAVPFMIEKGFVDAGVTASEAVERDWKNKGGRVIGETKPIPIKQLLASKKLSEADRTKLQNLMIGLSENDAGKAALTKIGLPGFVPWNTQEMTEAAARLGI